MRINLLKQQRGDTLVEVLLSTVVLSMVLAGAFSLSSRALRFNQTAVERTEVTNKMREQSELLRFIHSNREAGPLKVTWDEIVSYSGPGTPKAFFFDFLDASGNVRDATASGFVAAYSLGVDSYPGTEDLFEIRVTPRPVNDPQGFNYIDFVVEANWEGIGDLGPQSSGSVLRLER